VEVVHHKVIQSLRCDVCKLPTHFAFHSCLLLLVPGIGYASVKPNAVTLPGLLLTKNDRFNATSQRVRRGGPVAEAVQCVDLFKSERHVAS
jgi:hypothetical protein